MKSIIYWTILTGVCLFITFIFLEMWNLRKYKGLPKKPVVLSYVVVHLDLKGTPLKLSYLKSLLPKLKAAGTNSLLMEYEDMFPYEGRLVNLSADNCYQKTELQKFLTLAKKSGFEVIPLIQTFGHMEHALKLAEFQNLREVSLHPDSICPSNSEGILLLKSMIQQVIQFHDTISPLKYIHIGCDEVFHLNKCQNCIARNLSNVDIFLQHVTTVSAIVKSLTSDTTVLIWDDMLRGMKPKQWSKINYFHNIQPVYWDYTSTVQVMHRDLLMYHNKFPHIWIASAFKGADGRVATFPIIENRFLNVLSWMRFIQEYRFGGETGVYSFKGIILTGWSRYSHMDPPCELLPVAYPSLIVNLLVVQAFTTGDVFDTKPDKIDSLEVFTDNHLSRNHLECVKNNYVFDASLCKFDGRNLYNALAKYTKLKPMLLRNMDGLGVMYFEYYSMIGILNTNKILHGIEALTLDVKERKKLESIIIREMNKYYEEDFVIEYVNHVFYYDWKIAQTAQRLLNSYLKVRHWPRRTQKTFNLDEDLKMSYFYNKTQNKTR